MRVVDCMCFAGGLTWSFTDTGFELVAKRENYGGFGVPIVEANRHLLGNKWETEVCAPGNWTPVQADVVIGNPPCSGFSCLNSSSTRGIDSPVNQCMVDFVGYAARCLPTIVVMESVQQAYSGGRELMVRLRDKIEELTGFKYGITHALHSVAALGGSQLRRRYFLVLSRVPFGVDEREVTYCKSGLSFITDLMDHELAWDTFPDGHMIAGTSRAKRINKLLQVEPWAQGEQIGYPLDRVFDRGGIDAVEALGFQIGTVISSIVDSELGSPYATRRVRPDRLWPTITGASISNQVHPILDRTITYREAARLMGFPDDWTVKPCNGHRDGHKWFGKGVTTFAGRWIAKMAMAALKGNPFPVQGEEIGERERLVNVSNLFVKPPSAGGSDDDAGE